MILDSRVVLVDGKRILQFYKGNAGNVHEAAAWITPLTVDVKSLPASEVLELRNALKQGEVIK